VNTQTTSSYSVGVRGAGAAGSLLPNPPESDAAGGAILVIDPPFDIGREMDPSRWATFTPHLNSRHRTLIKFKSTDFNKQRDVVDAWDRRIVYALRPVVVGAQTYYHELLISPGVDGIRGTTDDIVIEIE
jgi:hypothetical protein